MPLTWRTVGLLYLCYVACRIACQLGPLGEGASTSHLRDPALIQQSLARFKQMGMASKALVVFVGIPLYLFSDLVPRELANLVSLTWHHAIKPCLDIAVDLVISACRFLCNKVLLPLCEWIAVIVTHLYRFLKDRVIYPLFDALYQLVKRLGTLLLDAIEWVLNLIDNAFLFIWERVLLPVARFLRDSVFLPLWRTLCDLYRAVKNAVVCITRYVINAWYAAMQWLWDHVMVPLAEAVRRFIHWAATLLWDYAVVPLWRALRWLVVDVVGVALAKLYDIVSNLHHLLWRHLIQPFLDFFYVVWVTARDIVLSLWRPVRDWLVDKFYRFCGFVYDAAASLWQLFAALWSAIYGTLGGFMSSIYQLIESLVMAIRDYVYMLGVVVYETLEVARDFVVSLFVRTNK